MVSLAAFFTGAVAGCNSDSRQPDYAALDGVFESIDSRNGRSEFRFRQEKTGQFKSVTGFIGSDCEILIDGVLSRRADIREGENAFVVWRIEHFGDGQVNQALRIRIDRTSGESSGES